MLLHFHHVPGRIRVALLGLKNNRCAAAGLRRALEDLPGVRAIAISLPIGSATLHYETGKFEPAAFWAVLRCKGLIDSDIRPHPLPVQAQPASPIANAVAPMLVEALAQHLVGHAGGIVARLLLSR